MMSSSKVPRWWVHIRDDGLGDLSLIECDILLWVGSTQANLTHPTTYAKLSHDAQQKTDRPFVIPKRLVGRECKIDRKRSTQSLGMAR